MEQGGEEQRDRQAVAGGEPDADACDAGRGMALLDLDEVLGGDAEHDPAGRLREQLGGAVDACGADAHAAADGQLGQGGGRTSLGDVVERPTAA